MRGVKNEALVSVSAESKNISLAGYYGPHLPGPAVMQILLMGSLNSGGNLCPNECIRSSKIIHLILFEIFECIQAACLRFL